MATVTTACIRHADYRDAIKLLFDAPRLRCVIINRSMFDVSTLSRDQKESVYSLPQTFTEMKVWDRYMPSRTFREYNALYQKAIKHNPHLQSLEIQHGQKFDSVHFALEGGKPVMIAAAYRVWLGDEQLQSLPGTEWPLREIVIKNCTNFLDATVIAIARHFRGLQVLRLGSMQLTDRSLEALAANCPGLLELSLDSGANLTDAGVAQLVQGCTKLRDLSLAFSPQCTDASVVAVAKHLPLLASMDLSHCRLITDAAVTALIQGCPSLVSLSLRNCPLITDAAIVALAQQSRGLHALNVAYCKLLTDASLVALAEHCFQLRLLSVTVDIDHIPGCAGAGISKSDVNALRRALPALAVREFRNYTSTSLI
jgi:hypothetical protein